MLLKLWILQWVSASPGSSHAVTSRTLCKADGLGDRDAVDGAGVPAGVQRDDPVLIHDVAVLASDARALHTDIFRSRANCSSSWKTEINNVNID